MEGGENEENVFENLMQLSKNSNEELWQEKYDKYIEHMSQAEAETTADIKIEPLDVKEFMKKYASLIMYMYIINLRDGPVHEKVMEAVYQFLTDGYDERRAVRKAIKTYKHLIQDYVDEDEEDDSEADENQIATDEEENQTDEEEADQ